MAENRRTSCDEFRRLRRVSRRQVLTAGALGGLSLPLIMSRPGRGAESAGPGFGRAKSCILLFMWGGPSQLDTLDPKPDAPKEVRGDFQPIATSVPGLQVSVHMPHLARIADKVAVLRSLTHDDPAHLSSVHASVTGQLAPVVKSDAIPPSERDTPHLGSVMAKLRPPINGMPGFVTMPWIVSHPAAPGGKAPGQYGGWLGRSYDPFLITGDPNQAGWEVPALQLLDGISTDRLALRQNLLETIDAQRAALDRRAVSAMTNQQAQAFDLLTSPDVRNAFNLGQESDAVRDRYGRHLHGQCVLLARRLVERGVPLVAVNWHDDGRTFWDTHGNNFNRLKDDLLPPSDRALAALLEDLDERGLLDETIVAWVGEFGRRPEITAGNAGREHWPFCYSGILAGAGIRGGMVHGASDKHAAYPTSNPVTPLEYAATLMHALGISPEQMLADQTGRPHRLYGADPVLGLWG